MTDRRTQYVIDVLPLLGRVVAGLRAFLERPMKAGGEAGSPNEPRRILEERVVVQNANELGFNVGDAIERIEQEPTRSLVEREGHRVDGEVAAAQVLMNGGRHHYRRLARFFEALRARHAHFRAGVSWQREEDSANVFFDGSNFGAG